MAAKKRVQPPGDNQKRTLIYLKVARKSYRERLRRFWKTNRPRPSRWANHWSEILGSLLILCILVGGIWAYWEAASWTPEMELRRLAAEEKARLKAESASKPSKNEAAPPRHESQ
jgi:hypothetical protein